MCGCGCACGCACVCLCVGRTQQYNRVNFLKHALNHTHTNTHALVCTAWAHIFILYPLAVSWLNNFINELRTSWCFAFVGLFICLFVLRRVWHTHARDFLHLLLLLLPPAAPALQWKHFLCFLCWSAAIIYSLMPFPFGCLDRLLCSLMFVV